MLVNHISVRNTETGGHKYRQVGRQAITVLKVFIGSKGQNPGRQRYKIRRIRLRNQEKKNRHGELSYRNAGCCSRRQDNLALTHRGALVKYTQEGRANETQVKHIRAGTGNHTGNRK